MTMFVFSRLSGKLATTLVMGMLPMTFLFLTGNCFILVTTIHQFTFQNISHFKLESGVSKWHALIML